MHPSSFENMQFCHDVVAPYITPCSGTGAKVLDLGSQDVNGSYRGIFSDPRYTYVGADLEAGANVDVVLDDPYVLPFSDESFDVVLSGQMLEHCEFFWRTFQEMVRVVSADGFIILIAPSAGPIHRYPVDCYRFYPDSYKALASQAGCHLLSVRMDERGPWNDLVGIFSKTPLDLPTLPDRQPFVTVAVSPSDDATHEVRRGRLPYLDVLADIHRHLDPRLYLEVGVRTGDSLRLAHCPAVAVDPEPQLSGEWANVDLRTQRSDDFFLLDAVDALSEGPDLAFIDGLHLFENALRDFMNIERLAHPASVVVIDDVLPNHPVQALRDRQSAVWCGDVWKLADCLERYRPDLQLLLLDSEPSGLLLVAGLDPSNRVLWERYNPIVREYWSAQYEEPPTHVLSRTHALAPDHASLTSTLRLLKAAREQELDVTHVQRALAHPSSRPSVVTEHRLPLSIVVVAFDMARELPRTLRSLSPLMQQGIDAADYELIVVDNGSRDPFDRELCESFGSQIRFIDVPRPTSSPCAAINLGLSLAQGDLVGVMIDGARMASPGLLSRALAGSHVHDRSVVATLAFHLGSEVQMASVPRGYDAATEDRLLASIDWMADGYRLFDISVFAGSSARGWLASPSESNALFLPQDLWRELGGYDEAFTSPGGGLVNLDTFTRACELPDSQLVMLLGEATFHQVHGGVATNASDPGASPVPGFFAEFERLRGRPFSPANPKPLHVGTVPSQVLPSLRNSLRAI